MTPWLALVACKAVLSAHQALPCRSIEFDLSITADDVFVVSHEPVAGKASDLKDVVGFDEFVDGMKGHRFEFVNVDLKERSLAPGDGRLTRALERHAAAFTKLAAQSKLVVATTPVPTRHRELERFLARTKTGMQSGYEVADYNAEDSRRWKLPFSRLDAVLMPFGRLANKLYLKWRGAPALRYLGVQERTAAAMKPEPGVELLCWTRDPASGPPPAQCEYTERAAVEP
jgi:hypothetical protein